MPRIADLTASAQRAHAARPTGEWGVSPGRFTVTEEAGARTVCGYEEECRITGGQGPPSAMTEGEFR